MIVEHQFLNKEIVALSIGILILVCVSLIIMVFVLSIAYRNLQLRLKDRSVRKKSGVLQKHYLTGLDNRASLLDKLEYLFEKDRKSSVSTALMFIDLDDFNNINGSVGPRTADGLLQTIADRIVNYMYVYSKMVYHIGSDEFSVILHDCGTNNDNLIEITNGLLEAITNPVYLDGYDLHVSCSIGVCIYPDCARNAEELLKHAGCARDNAKKIGYGSYSFYTKDMSKESIFRNLMSSDLRYALSRNELTLEYQAKVDSNTGAVQGAEALLRWRHPSLGNITPDVFIPIMEDLGLIHPIGKWVFHAALKDMNKLHKQGFDNISIAVNVSPQQFNRGDIAEVIAEAIWDAGIPPHKVEIELTEALVMQDTEKTLLMLKVLKSMGIKIAVDDFGTGYSSMNRLTSFPISILKIDRSFVHEMHLNPVKAAIVSTIIKMSKQLGFEVVAEGVESEEELQNLRQEGCDLIQGFYYTKPLPFDEFVKYVIKSNSNVNKFKDNIDNSREQSA